MIGVITASVPLKSSNDLLMVLGRFKPFPDQRHNSKGRNRILTEVKHLSKAGQSIGAYKRERSPHVPIITEKNV